MRLLPFGLLILGTNLFTYNLASYRTTHRVLTAAQSRLDDGLRAVNMAESLAPVFRSDSRLWLAIREAGGRYYGWNEYAMGMTLGGCLVLVGAGLPFVRRN